MFKKSLVVTIIFILSTFIQLVSQIVVTRIFGATLELDIFLASVALPTIFVTVIYGTLNDAFLPLYGEYRSKYPKHHEAYLFLQLLRLTIFGFLIALAVQFFTKPISLLLYGSRGEIFSQKVSLQMNFMIWSIPLSIIATILGSYFYIHKRFNRFPIAQLLGSAANLVIIILLWRSIGIWALVFAFVLNILIQILFVISSNLVKFFSLSYFTNFMNFKNFITVLTAWFPLIIGNFALRSDTLLIRSFAAFLPTGYLVYLNLTSKIFSLATSVTTIGIQIVLLPHLVEYFAKKQYREAILNIRRAKIFAVLVSVFITAATLIIIPFIVNFLFVGGKFNPKDAVNSLALVPFFIIPAIGWGVNNVFFQPLIALKKQKQLGILNITALFFAWAAASISHQRFGPLIAIESGLIILLFTGIIGSEILWQYYKKKLLEKQTLP